MTQSDAKPNPAAMSERGRLLERLLEQRILVLDGAMGTMIQRHGLEEGDYRGERFADSPHDLRGNNDLLSLTQPQLIREIHSAYLDAGADIIETNSFNSTSISMADYHMEDLVYELNVASATLAREAADAATTADKPRFVAGVVGPTNRTASMSPDVNDPGFRNVTLRDLAGAYGEAARGLIAGGADILLIETVFDTLNAKAAIFAIEEIFEETGRRLPVMISGTITDASGRTLSGQTVEAFWNSVAHANPLIVGLNCALGPDTLAPYVRELARRTPTFVSTHPNAGLPNELGGYDETPESMAQVLGELARQGVLNVVGGCCGTTPQHIEAFAEVVRDVAPRKPETLPSATRLSGLEPLTIDSTSLFVNVGERTNVTGSRRFARLVREGDYEAAVAVARQQVENGAQMIDVNMDEGMLDSEEAMGTFLRLIAAEPDIARVPVVVDSSKWSVIEAGLQCLQGKGVVNSISLKEGEEAFLEQARRVRRYGAAVIVMAFDEEGQAGEVDRKVAHLPARLPHCSTEEVGFAPGGHHLRPQHLCRRHRHRRTQRLRRGLHRSGPPNQGRHAPARWSAAGCPTCRFRSAATKASAAPCTRCSCTTPSKPAWTWASSMPASWRCSPRSSPTCGNELKTSSSIAAPTPPNDCWRWPTPFRTPGSRRERISSGATSRSRTGWPTPSSTA